VTIPTPLNRVHWCTTCDLPEHRWNQLDRLHIEGSHQCPDCRRADIEDDHDHARREDQ
jgi:hypothetical protein